MTLAEDLSQLVDDLRRTLPEEVFVEATSEASMDALLPEEAAVIRNWAPQRQLQFAAGRSCARLALTRLGYSAIPVLFDDEGAPLWPSGIVGSISHKRQHCIVVVARSSAVRSVGIDLERDVTEPEEVEAEIIRRVCRSTSERTQVRRFRGTVRSPGTLFLSAKEAYFKFQFRFTADRLDWTDVEIAFNDLRFLARVIGRAATPMSEGVVSRGAYWLASVCY